MVHFYIRNIKLIYQYMNIIISEVIIVNMVACWLSEMYALYQVYTCIFEESTYLLLPVELGANSINFQIIANPALTPLTYTSATPA